MAHKVKTKPIKQEQVPEEEPRLGLRGYAGVVLIGGALMSLPQPLKNPGTTENQMMLVIAGAMIIAGLMLLILPGYFKKRRNK